MIFQRKIEMALNNYAYRQAPLGFLASFICATIVILTAINTVERKIALIWYLFFIVIIVLRIVLIRFYKKGNKTNIKTWRRLYVLASFITGAAWGFTGVLLISTQNSIYLTFIVLILGGITAASVPLFAGILPAAFVFLILTIVPTAIHLLFMKNPLYILLAAMMGAYLIVLLAMSIRQHKMIKKSYSLQFENKELLKKQASLIKKLERTASHDSLTNLANRSLFVPFLSQAIQRSQRINTMLGLLFLDLDNFKQVNDEYGHHMGDLLLIEIAKRLKNILRKTDVVFRLGGDEFAIILENILHKKNIITIAENIITSLTNVIKIEDFDISIGISIGISLCPIDGIEMNTLLKGADIAMYYAKKHGGNTFCFSSELEKKHLSEK
jgi:diguanylate cyclase (GGDEF)-like protein